MTSDDFSEITCNIRNSNRDRIISACESRYPDTMDWLKTDSDKIVYMALQHAASIEHVYKINESLKHGRV